MPNITLSGALPTGRQVEGSQVILKVYDVLGNEIATLVNEEKPAGNYELEFSVGRFAEADSPDIASGIYFNQLSATGEASEFVETKKMILLK